MARIKPFIQLLQKHKRIGIDSCVFIYKFEQHPRYEPLCSVIFEALSHHKIELITSIITVSEVLIQPIKKKQGEIVLLYENVFETLPHFSLVPIDYAQAKAAALLRAEYTLRGPDALHIAAMLTHGAEIFITNDRRLKKVKDLKIVCLQEYM